MKLEQLSGWLPCPRDWRSSLPVRRVAITSWTPIGDALVAYTLPR